MLSKWDGNEPERGRVNLLTLHSTKGLEFSRVYIVGVEDAQLPGGSPTTGPTPDEIEEARRLLYVGMTRTKDRLVLTRVATRGGKPTRRPSVPRRDGPRRHPDASAQRRTCHDGYRVASRRSATTTTTRRVRAGDVRRATSAVFVCAHGAGGSMSDRATLAAANALRAHGFGVVRFNFLYKERGSGRPDPMPKLMETFAAVVERVARRARSRAPLIIGGRSMGGRAASMLAADGFAADGLLLLAYPLHPPGNPRSCATRTCRGSRCPCSASAARATRSARRELMERALTTVTAPWEMHWLEGADHSFHVLKSSGRNDAAVVDEMADASVRWVVPLAR